MRQRTAVFVMVLTVGLATLASCSHRSTTEGCDICKVDAVLQDAVPAAMSPGDTATFHFQIKVLSATLGPVSGLFQIFPDKNLEYTGLLARSGTGGAVQLGGTDFPEFDQPGLAVTGFGPLNPSQTAFLDLQFRLIDNPIDYHEPSGYFSAHVGVVFLPDPYGGTYNSGVATDHWIHITTQQ